MNKILLEAVLKKIIKNCKNMNERLLEIIKNCKNMNERLLETVLKKIIRNCQNMNKILLKTVVVKLVVGSQRRQSSHSDAVREEYLCGAVDPGGSFFKL
jgi:hypothetical protein